MNNDKMRDKLLRWISHLPVWKTHQSKGRKKDWPYKGRIFVVTWKTIWVFKWIHYVIDIRYEDEWPGEFE